MCCKNRSELRRAELSTAPFKFVGVDHVHVLQMLYPVYKTPAVTYLSTREVSHVTTMDRSGRILAALLLVSWIATTATAPSTVADYVVSTVNHLVSVESGVPKIVFYAFPGDGQLDRVIRSPRLENVSRLVVTCGAWDVQNLPPEPTLIVMQGNITACPAFARRSLLSLKASTKVLGLVSFAEQLVHYINILSKLRFLKVVLIQGYGSTNKFPIPERIFPRNYFGNRPTRPITVVERQGYLCGTFRKTLLNLTAILTNSTVLRLAHPCQNNDNLCFGTFMLDYLVDFDCTIYSWSMLDEKYYDSLTTSITDTEVILVPQSPLSTIELFLLPLNWKVWTILLLLIFALEILHLAIPTAIRNDPFLFIVCGFEKHDLHSTTRREKFVLFPMVVLMFFITSAYSTILLSLLINRPASQPIRTLQEFVESGIKIKSNPKTNSYFSQNPILGHLVVPSTESVFNMDLVHAHVVVRETAKLVLPSYYDPANRMYRYNILDQTLNMVIYRFRLAKRSDLLETLQFVTSALIESGIKDLLRYSTETLSKRLSAVKIDDELHFADMVLAWLAILCGLSTAAVAFVVELSLGKMLPGCASNGGFWSDQRQTIERLFTRRA